MLKIAVTGSTGLIGSRIIELLSPEFEFIPILQEKLDITQKDAVRTAIKNLDFDILFHLAGYTNVDQAEEDKTIAYEVNVEGTRNLFESVMKKRKKFIFVSTDFVFDGVNPPFFEDSTPNPISYYGTTKYEGEKIVNGKGMVVRFSYPYRASFEPKKDFVRNIKSLLEKGQKITMVQDSLITPTFVDDIAYAMKHLFNNFSPEIFHINGMDSISPYAAGKTIAKIFGMNDTLIQPVSYQKYFKNRAKRPQYSEIKMRKNNFFKMKKFSEGLRSMLKNITI